MCCARRGSVPGVYIAHEFWPLFKQASHCSSPLLSPLFSLLSRLHLNYLYSHLAIPSSLSHPLPLWSLQIAIIGQWVQELLTGQGPIEQITAGHISPFGDGQGLFCK